MRDFDVSAGRVVWRGDGETLVVQAWGRNSLRVRSALLSDVVDTDFALLPPGPAEAQMIVDGPRATISNGKLTAVPPLWEGSVVDHS